MKTLACTLAVAALLSACAEGYPSRDEGMYLHFEMSEAEALTALNRVGAREHLSQTWRYDLKDGCMLQVTTQHGKFRKDVETVDLSQAEPTIFQSGAGDSYSAELQSTSDKSVSITVLTKGTWSDVTMVRWLLDYLPKFCA